MRRRGVGSKRLESSSSEFSRLCLVGRERTSRLGDRGAATSLRPWRGVGPRCHAPRSALGRKRELPSRSTKLKSEQRSCEPQLSSPAVLRKRKDRVKMDLNDSLAILNGYA